MAHIREVFSKPCECGRIVRVARTVNGEDDKPLRPGKCGTCGTERPVDKGWRTAYEVRWRVNGREQQSTFGTRRQADRKKQKVEVQLAEGETPEYTRRETVSEIVDKVLAGAERKLKPRSLGSLRQIHQTHVLPKWGKRRINTITSQQYEAWIGELADKKAPSTVRHIHGAFFQVAKYAVRHNIIANNPAVGVDLPSVNSTRQAVFLTKEQVSAIAAALDRHPPYGLLVRFATATGLRAGELAGMRIRDVNLLKKEILVERSAQRIDKEWVVGTPKSRKSVRTVPLLDDALVRELADFLAQHPYRADREAGLWPGRNVGGDYALNFDKPHHHGSFYAWYFKAALVRAGLLGQVVPLDDGTWRAIVADETTDFHTEEEAVRHVASRAKGGPRFHDLRHTAGSSWIKAGVDLFTVSRWMGHSSISITADIYGHRLPGDTYEKERELVRQYLTAAN